MIKTSVDGAVKELWEESLLTPPIDKSGRRLRYTVLEVSSDAPSAMVVRSDIPRGFSMNRSWTLRTCPWKTGYG